MAAAAQIHDGITSTSVVPGSQIKTAFLVAVSTSTIGSAALPQSTPVRQNIVSQFSVSSTCSVNVPNVSDGSAFNGGTSVTQAYKAENEPQWMQDSLNRIKKIGSLPENWAGSGFNRASEKAVVDAERFLLKLVHLGLSIPPAIGLDDDGSFSFYLARENFVADLSIRDDGTYSYYAQLGDDEISSEDSSIDGPIDQQLADMLVA